MNLAPNSNSQTQIQQLQQQLQQLAAQIPAQQVSLRGQVAPGPPLAQ